MKKIGLIGGELPLILTEESYCGIKAFNTTKIHVDKIVETCLK
jgi:hypothetical protein